MAKTTKKAATAKSTKKTSAASMSTSTRKRKAPITAPLIEITPEERWRMIAVSAYHKSEKRDFAPGREVDDWLEAESEVDQLLGGS